MIDILIMVVSFLIAISILVAVHEFGHFWVAKKLGVKVLRFSLGMGKPLWKKTFGKDNTEFVIAAFPIGGYVAMLNEQEQEVPEEDLTRAFNRQPIWKRSLIVLAGPVFNFLFAILAYWLVSVSGVTGAKPMINQIDPDSIAAKAGLDKGMQIVSVEGWQTATWDAMFQEMLPRMVERSELKVTAKDKAGIEKEYTLNLSSLQIDRDIRSPFDAIGLYFFDSPAIVHDVAKGKSAEAAGLKPGDQIIKLGDKDIIHWKQVSRYVEDKYSQALPLRILRDGQELELTITTYDELYHGRKYGRLGVIFKPDRSKNKIEFDKNQRGPIESVTYSLHRTWNVSYLITRVLGHIISGEMSVLNLSGPLAIADAAGRSARHGIDHFILLLALVSLSLGIMNLLPIPVLDGGHLFYYIVEAVKGSPVSTAFEDIAMRIGIALLIMLMVLALFNDILRLATQ